MRIVLEHQVVTRKDKKTLRERVRQWRAPILVLLVLAAVSIGTIRFVRELSQIRWFTLEHVEVLGHLQETTIADIVRFSNVKMGTNLFGISLGSVRARILKHPWVREVSVRRLPPNTLSIQIEEYTPRALVLFDQLMLISTEGVVFKPLEIEAVRDLPVLTGFSKDDTPRLRKMLEHLAFLESQSVEKNFGISELHEDPALGLMLVTLKNPVEVVLGFGDFEKKLKRLARLLQSPEVLQKKIVRIDLNYEDKAFITYRS